MLTVDKLVKTMAYEEKRKKEKDEKRKIEMSKIELFNNIENEEEWNLKKQETQEKRKKDMENHIIKLQNKRNESIEQLEKYKKEKQMSLPIFNHITNENAWKQERNRLKIKRNKEHQQRMMNKEEAIIQKNELIPRENIKAGDRVKAYCYDVRREPRGQQIFLSRAHPKFMEKLFIQEVPEIYDGLIEIISSARDPGSRAKICVKAIDNSLDPVGACVGMRGSRVQAVVNELQGEKIDIVNWSEDPAVVVSNALSPAEVLRVNVDAESKKLDVILTDENLSKAIGRRGQNVRLATKLMNYEINIMTDQEDSERRQVEFKEKTENFVKNLELDETLGQLLVAEGFSSIDDIKDSSIEALTKIEGIEEETAKELIDRANEFHQKDQQEISNKIKDLGLDNELINHEGLTPGMLVTLGEQKILTLTDFADLASDELTGGYDVVKGERVKIRGYLEDFALSKNEADQLIMSARDKVYKD